MNFDIKLNNKKINYNLHKFKSGEIHVTLKDFELADGILIIRGKINTPELFFELSMLKNALEYSLKYNKVIYRLYSYYIPYSRQDRICSSGEAFGLKVFTEMLNNLKFDEVITLDNHSLVTNALLNNNLEIDTKTMLSNLKGILNKYDYFISPDASSYKKVEGVARLFNKPVIIATKVINDKGQIIKSELLTNEDLNNKKILIIDDICQGGKTFIEIAKNIKENYNLEILDLYISHGFFDNQEIFKYFNNIYCSDSVEQITNDKNLIIVKLYID